MHINRSRRGEKYVLSSYVKRCVALNIHCRDAGPLVEQDSRSERVTRKGSEHERRNARRVALIDVGRTAVQQQGFESGSRTERSRRVQLVPRTP